MLLIARLRGWHFRGRRLRQSVAWKRCDVCSAAKRSKHRPCFDPYCFCWCSRFHDVRVVQGKPKDWNGLLVKQ